MTASLHVSYYDGSNPFCMINAKLKDIEKELIYQVKIANNPIDTAYVVLNNNTYDAFDLFNLLD